MFSDFIFLWLGTLKARLWHLLGKINSGAEVYSTCLPAYSDNGYSDNG